MILFLVKGNEVGINFETIDTDQEQALINEVKNDSRKVKE